jgi:hypothetical protein
MNKASITSAATNLRKVVLNNLEWKCSKQGPVILKASDEKWSL